MKKILIFIIFLFWFSFGFAQRRLQATTERQFKADSIQMQRLKERVNKKKENIKELKACGIGLALVAVWWTNSVLKR